MDVKQTALKLWVYWSISYTFSEGGGGMKSEKEVGSAALVQLLIWFSISRTCQRALLSSLTVDWLPRNVFLSLARSRSLFLTLCAQSWPALEFYCHIFLHTAWRNVPKSAANISFIFAHNNKNQFNASNIWRSMQTTTSGLNAHKNTRIYGIYNILYFSLYMPAKYFWQQLKYLPPFAWRCLPQYLPHYFPWTSRLILCLQSAISPKNKLRLLGALALANWIN